MSFDIAALISTWNLYFGIEMVSGYCRTSQSIDSSWESDGDLEVDISEE